MACGQKSRRPEAEGPGHSATTLTESGGMAERTNARLLKSREVQASGGSNPPPSASQRGFWNQA